jgi:hypothetical protein
MSSTKIQAIDIEVIVRRLDKSKVYEYIEKTKTPFSVCKGVSEVEWRKFVDTYDSESGSMKLRYLEFWSGSVLVVEMPSHEHECTVRSFMSQFIRALGSDEFPMKGSVKRHHMEPDDSFGPFSNLKGPAYHTRPLPAGLKSIRDWLTFVLEVAYSQNKESLERKLKAWAKVPGMKYLLAITVTEKLQWYSYRLYHIEDDWAPTTEEPLPATIIQSDLITCENGIPQIVNMNTRELLGLCDDSMLPQVNDNVVIDLQRVISLAMQIFT